MFYFVLFLFVNLSVIVHSGKNGANNSWYTINFDIPYLSDQTEIYEIQNLTVVRNKIFTITLKNFIPKSVTCRTKSEVAMKVHRTHGNYIMKMKPATVDMTGKWNCDILRHDNQHLLLTFFVRVVGDPRKVKIEIGGREVPTELRVSPELPYDEIGEYNFEDGETIQYMCRNIHDVEDQGDIFIQYYDSKGTPLIVTELMYSRNEPAFFQRTMKSLDNNHMIDCIYITREYQLKFPYRVIFKLKPSTDNDLTITVNDIKLTPFGYLNEGGRTIYPFIYFENNYVLNVTCETNDTQYNSIQIMDENKKIGGHHNNLLKTTAIIKTKDIDDYGADLSVKRMIRHPSQILEDTILLRDSKISNLIILGLNTENIIQQYTKNSNTWVIDYRCNSETLILSCIVKNKHHLRWIFRDSPQTYHNKKEISHNFTLNKDCNEKTIICEEKSSKKTIINLHSKQIPALYDPNPTKSIINGKTTRNDTSRTNSNSTPNPYSTPYPTRDGNSVTDGSATRQGNSNGNSMPIENSTTNAIHTTESSSTGYGNSIPNHDPTRNGNSAADGNSSTNVNPTVNTGMDSDTSAITVIVLAVCLPAVATIGCIYYYCRYTRLKKTQNTTENLLNRCKLQGPRTEVFNSYDPNYHSQEYMVRNSIYDPKADENVYHYIEIYAITKANEEANNPQSANLYINANKNELPGFYANEARYANDRGGVSLQTFNKKNDYGNIGI